MITTIQPVKGTITSTMTFLLASPLVKRMILFFVGLLFSVGSFAQTDADGIPDRPNPARLVNNLSTEKPNLLSAQEEAQLEQKLEAFANQTSNQIVIVIADDLKGLEPYDFATRLGHKWGIGQAKMDNGIVILVKPTDNESGKHVLDIAVGYGLEGAIPDLTTKQIRENEMNPYFKSGDFFTGLDKGTDVLMALAKGEYNSDAYGKKKNKGFPAGILIPIIFLIIFILIRGSRGGRGGGMTMSSSGFLLGALLGGGGRGSGGGFGGGSSGGFGGFGGGGFGGGGSSVSW
jgi:uncharacterized protein